MCGLAPTAPPDAFFETVRERDRDAARKFYRKCLGVKGTPAARDPVGYWAAGVEAYFDADGPSPLPILADQPIVTREALRAYNQDLYALVEETMAYRGHADWRYRRPPPHE